MPRKIPLTEKRNWLRRYEGGESEMSIADEARRDIRTVKRGIEEARLERDAASARAELLKNALRKHQDQLMAVIQSLLTTLVVPAPSLELRRSKDDALLPITLAEATVSYDEQKGLVLLLHTQHTPQWELLREHLRYHRLWRTLTMWKTAVIEHIQARLSLKIETRMLLEEKTNFEVIRDIDEAPHTSFLFPMVVEFLYQATLNRLLGILGDTDLERQLVATSDPYVRLGEGGAPLAHARGSLQKCKKNIIEAFEELQTSSATVKVTDTYAAVTESTARARQPLEEISLLGVVPGQCRVCRLLGI